MVIDPRVVSTYELGGDDREVIVGVVDPKLKVGVEDCDNVWIGAEVVTDCEGDMTLLEDVAEGAALLCSPVLLLLGGGATELGLGAEDECSSVDDDDGGRALGLGESLEVVGGRCEDVGGSDEEGGSGL